MLSHSGVGWHIMCYELFQNKKAYGWVCQDILSSMEDAVKAAKRLAKAGKGKFLGVEGKDGEFID